LILENLVWLAGRYLILVPLLFVFNADKMILAGLGTEALAG